MTMLSDPLSMPLFYLIYIFFLTSYVLFFFIIHTMSCLVYILCGFFWASFCVFSLSSNNFSSTCVSMQLSKCSKHKLKQRNCKQLDNFSREDMRSLFVRFLQNLYLHLDRVYKHWIWRSLTLFFLYLWMILEFVWMNIFYITKT